MTSLPEYFFGSESTKKSVNLQLLYTNHFQGAGLTRRQEAAERETRNYHRDLAITNALLSLSSFGIAFLESPKKYWLLCVPILTEAYRFFTRTTHHADLESSIRALEVRDARPRIDQKVP